MTFRAATGLCQGSVWRPWSWRRRGAPARSSPPDFAVEQNRQVFAVPGSPLDPRAEGTNDLLKQGASICTCADDVLTALEPMRSNDLGAMRETGGETSEPLWGEQSLFGVDPDSTPRTQAGDEFDDAGGAAYRTGDDAEAARDRIIALLGPSPTTLDELGRAAEASARDGARCFARTRVGRTDRIFR